MNEIIKIIQIDDSKESYSVVARKDLRTEIEDYTTKAFKGIVQALGHENIDYNIKSYHLLESFIFANLAKPLYQRDDYVVIKNEFLESIPNETLKVRITGVLPDITRCKTLYSVNYNLDSEYCFKVIEEKQILGKQENETTLENCSGRTEMERYQILKGRQRVESLVEEK